MMQAMTGRCVEIAAADAHGIVGKGATFCAALGARTKSTVVKWFAAERVGGRSSPRATRFCICPLTLVVCARGAPLEPWTGKRPREEKRARVAVAGRSLAPGSFVVYDPCVQRRSLKSPMTK